MHKAIFLEGSIRFSIRPNGPILIKASDSGAADPTLPSMEFVRTRRNGQNQVYLPGSSLKGVIRAQAERICRSLDSEALQESRKYGDEPPIPLADNPLGTGTTYRGLDDFEYSSGRAVDELVKANKNKGTDTAMVYRRSSFVSQIFGHTSLAGHVRFADAYCDDFKPEYLEERNGVAIDRIYGSVAAGPFNYETVIDGTFRSQIMFKNLSLAQLALLGLSLRDLAEGRIGIGFAKSRGFGQVNVTFHQLELYYPSCSLVDQTLCSFDGKTKLAEPQQFLGIGALAHGEEYEQYNFPSEKSDTAGLPTGLELQPDDFMGVRVQAEGDQQVRALWGACMPAWKQELSL